MSCTGVYCGIVVCTHTPMKLEEKYKIELPQIKIKLLQINLKTLKKYIIYSSCTLNHVKFYDYTSLAPSKILLSNAYFLQINFNKVRLTSDVLEQNHINDSHMAPLNLVFFIKFKCLTTVSNNRYSKYPNHCRRQIQSLPHMLIILTHWIICKMLT